MKKANRILVTSALPYANGPLHLGHIAGAYLPADVYVRYQRLQGRDVLFICGSDEHGVPITVTADKEGISPQAVVDRYHAMNAQSFNELGISFDHYSRTSLPIHHQTAQTFFNVLHNKGDLIIKEEKQFYSEASKRFLPDRYVEGKCPHCDTEGARGDQCDHCGKWLETGDLIEPRSKIDGSVPVLKSTKHWYLPMGRFAEGWKSWFDQHSWKENVKHYCHGWYKEGLGDRPITRDLHWGVPVPLEEAKGKVLYVWFDAPIGYISSTMEWASKREDPDAWKRYWQEPDTKLVHFIGKDNIVFHAILFPMMLMEVGGYVLPDAIPANEYLTIEGKKISTSQNYAIWLKDYLETFPPDPLRYTLAANAPETKDTDFSWRQFQSRNNDELADILGNLVNRTLTFVHRMNENCVPEREAVGPEDRAVLERIGATKKAMEHCFESFEVRQAVREFMELCRTANKYFNDKAPWKTRESDPVSCATTLNVCLQICRALTVLIAPVLPDSSEALKKMLGVEGALQWEDVGNSELPAGHRLGESRILFPKIEDDVIEQEIQKLQNNDNKPEKGPMTDALMIDIKDFQRVELRTGIILQAEKVSGADKLLKVQVDMGGKTRQIVVGVAEEYVPEKITGKTVIVASNLKPAVIRGVESQGMILAVLTKNGYSLLTTDGPSDPGVRVE